ncbi:type II toxin-antitoxin system PemK/MazF family toxin [Candidatus Woesearchaeota archaeon]|nr:type II toxin-antitoxin system PemK/MazF family toxin [Candidatus Woesearchaeota archaeon]
MERFVKGDIVVLLFPFSDLSNLKKRPGLIIGSSGGDDYIICQITSKEHDDGFSVPASKGYVRVNKIFTADKSLIVRKHSKFNKMELVKEKLQKLFF